MSETSTAQPAPFTETTSMMALKDLYFLLDRNFNKIFAACKNDDERDLLRQAYVTSRDNFWEARNRIFVENDPHIVALNTELKAVDTDIKASLKAMKDAAKVLALVASAVRLGSTLLTVGAIL